MAKVVELSTREQKDIRWPIDCLLPKLDDYEEILIIAKKKGSEGYTRLSTDLNSTFWWLGCLDAVKRLIQDEGLTIEDEW